MADLSDFLRASGVEFSTQSSTDAVAFERRWLKAFAGNVKDRHGAWVYRGYRWHGFSYELQPCLTGAKALAAYSNQWPAQFVVFDEDLTECLLCKSEDYPDLSILEDDIYVSHANLKWTMVFTHEHPELGPYFSENATL